MAKPKERDAGLWLIETFALLHFFLPSAMIHILKILLLAFVPVVSMAQNIRVEIEAPVHDFLRRQELLGRIQGEYSSIRPFSIDQINDMLTEVDSSSQALEKSELEKLAYYKWLYTRSNFPEGISPPWKVDWNRHLKQVGQTESVPFLLTYNIENTFGWISWKETFRMESNKKGSRGHYIDQLGIFGKKGAISFETQYLFHRAKLTTAFPELPDSYQGGFVLDQQSYDIEWLSFGENLSSLAYSHPDFSISMNRGPVYWGYSPENSPILSANVRSIPYLKWTTKIKHLRYTYIHGGLSQRISAHNDSTKIQRYLVGQRVEFDITPKLEFSFNEFIIYSNRGYELGYLNPVNFLFSEEQLLGDLDNKLMAIDLKYKIKDGLQIYGTWFFDELNFNELFSSWWGNKFVFQAGFSYYPRRDLPSVTIEYTAARPWTYSHILTENSFTSGEQILGFKYGPNTQTLIVYSYWQPTPRLFSKLTYAHIVSGSGSGSDVYSNHRIRDELFLDEAPFLVGEISVNREYHFLLDYRASGLLNFFCEISEVNSLMMTTGLSFNF